MTTHFESVHPDTLYPDAFHVAPPEIPVARDLFPRRPGVFIRQGAATQPPPAQPALTMMSADYADSHPQSIQIRKKTSPPGAPRLAGGRFRGGLG